MPETLSRREFVVAAAALGLSVLGISSCRRETADETRSVLSGPDCRCRDLDLEIQDSDYERAIERVKQSIFRVSGPRGHGSGFLLHDGYVLTNDHVTHNNEHRIETRAQPFVLPLPMPIDPPAIINITAINEPNYKLQCFTDDDRTPGMDFRAAPVQLSDGSRARHRDMALLRLPPDVLRRLPAGMRPVEIGADPRMGQNCLVLGSPADLLSHVGHGRIARPVVMAADGWGEKRWENVPFVVTDAPVNGGNSGGAMFRLRRVRGADGRPELKTELIGMPTYAVRGQHGMGGCIRADYISFVATTRWGLPLMTDAQVEEYRRRFPTAAA